MSRTKNKARRGKKKDSQQQKQKPTQQNQKPTQPKRRGGALARLHANLRHQIHVLTDQSNVELTAKTAAMDGLDSAAFRPVLNKLKRHDPNPGRCNRVGMLLRHFCEQTDVKAAFIIVCAIIQLAGPVLCGEVLRCLGFSEEKGAKDGFVAKSFMLEFGEDHPIFTTFRHMILAIPKRLEDEIADLSLSDGTKSESRIEVPFDTLKQEVKNHFKALEEVWQDVEQDVEQDVGPSENPVQESEVMEVDTEMVS